MPRTWRDALTAARRQLRAAGVEEADIEAEVLLRHALSGSGSTAGAAPTEAPTPAVTRAHLFTRLDERLDPAAASRFDGYIERRLRHEPSAYITGHREFYGLDFLVTPATLIPRPETEVLVEAAIELGRRFAGPDGAPLLIADVGTGSGAIAVSLARALPRGRVFAIDVSAAALVVARTNAERHAVSDRVEFLAGDLLSPLAAPVDLIVANLPYVMLADYEALAPELRDFEPRSALDGGADGLEVIRRLLATAPPYLRPGASLLLEFGAGQEDMLTALARAAFAGARLSVRSDLAGRPRALTISL